MTRFEAIAIARSECRRRGVPWYEPIVVHAGWRTWSIRTLACRRGGNVHIIVDQRNGKVRKLVWPEKR